MAGTSNSITTHNVLSGVLNADNVISGLVNTAFNPAYALVTQAGAQIVLFINNNDYKMYAQLKDKSGNLIYTSNIIDLPLETMVVDGRYDSNTKKLILVLDNGNEIKVPLEALINGLVNEDDLIANYYDKDEIDTLLDGYWTKIELTQEDIDNWNAANAAFESELFDDGVISIEDSTEANINNTMNKSQLKIDLKGNTYQESTTGKNLLGLSNYAYNSNGVNCVVNNGIITLNGTATANTFIRIALDSFVFDANTYTLSANNTNTLSSNDLLRFVNANGVTVGNSLGLNIANASQTMTFSTTTDTLNLQIRIENGTTVSNFVIKPMLEVGSSATSYEPYTGNQPSPSPDYPQDIQVVTGDNTIKVEGKNLCNGITQNYFVNQAATRCGYAVGDRGLIIEVDGVSDYTISSNTVQTRYRVGCLNEIPVEGGSNPIVYNSSNKDGTSDSVTINTNGYKYLIVNATDLTAIQIEKESSASEFQPYQSASYPISLGNIELCKIGDYQDSIKKSTGKNLLNISDITSGNGITNNGDGTITLNGTITNTSFTLTNPFTLKANKTYILSLTNTYSNGSNSTFILRNGSTNIMTIYFKNKSSNAPFTPTQDTVIDTLRIFGDDVNFSNYTFSIQLEENNQYTSYEPYGKVWYVHKDIGKVVLDGSEGWQYWASGLMFYFSPTLLNYLQEQNKVLSLSNYYVCLRQTTSGNDFRSLTSQYNYAMSFSNELDGLRLKNIDITSVADLKTWLSTHNTIVYYILATPTITEITDTTLIEQLDNLENAYSYDTQTNITQTNDDMPFILDINAIADNVNGLKLENENQEYKTNKVIELSSNSTDDEYPSAKCVYDIVGNIEAVLAAMDSGSGV